jgi:hypothetical protein
MERVLLPNSQPHEGFQSTREVKVSLLTGKKKYSTLIRFMNLGCCNTFFYLLRKGVITYFNQLLLIFTTYYTYINHLVLISVSVTSLCDTVTCMRDYRWGLEW